MNRLAGDDTSADMHVGSILGEGGIQSAKRVAIYIEISAQMIGNNLRAISDRFAEPIYRDTFW